MPFLGFLFVLFCLLDNPTHFIRLSSFLFTSQSPLVSFSARESVVTPLFRGIVVVVELCFISGLMYSEDYPKTKREMAAAEIECFAATLLKSNHGFSS
jgi:hypothetical protein